MQDGSDHLDEDGNEDHDVYVESHVKFGASKSNLRGAEDSLSDHPLKPRDEDEAADAEGRDVHVIKKGVRCETDTRGHAAPRGRSPLEIVVDASEGFVPLWEKNSVLRWRFRESSMNYFENVDAAKKEIRSLLGAAILKWGGAAPIKFSERKDAWDFEIVMRKKDNCDANGCVLASAFFPDAGRHELILYPQLFNYEREEQVDTLAHEVGHIFGLRHFFANVSEKEWPSQIFGEHKPFTIMNYGDESVLTDADRSDLGNLYRSAWSGELTEINGTPIRLVAPYHTMASAGSTAVAAAMVSPTASARLRVTTDDSN